MTSSKKKSTEKGKLSHPVSMTGFGRSVLNERGVRLEIELRSLNNRYLDISLRLPKEYTPLEFEIRQMITATLERGRVDISISRRVLQGRAGGVVFQEPVFSGLYDVFMRVGKKAKVLDHEFSRQAVLQILARREVFEVVEDSDSMLSNEAPLLRRGLQAALLELKRSRAGEGKRLTKDVSQRFSELAKLHTALENKAGLVPKRVHERLRERVRLLSAEGVVNEERLSAEVAVLADRYDISEELVRFHSHLKEADELLASSGTGRRLDFLLQEFGRELNTMGSKANDALISSLVVKGKAVVEKIREQVQNFE